MVIVILLAILLVGGAGSGSIQAKCMHRPLMIGGVIIVSKSNAAQEAPSQEITSYPPTGASRIAHMIVVC